MVFRAAWRAPGLAWHGIARSSRRGRSHGWLPPDPRSTPMARASVRCETACTPRRRARVGDRRLVIEVSPLLPLDARMDEEEERRAPVPAPRAGGRRRPTAFGSFRGSSAPAERARRSSSSPRTSGQRAGRDRRDAAAKPDRVPFGASSARCCARRPCRVLLVASSLGASRASSCQRSGLVEHVVEVAALRRLDARRAAVLAGAAGEHAGGVRGPALELPRSRAR